MRVENLVSTIIPVHNRPDMLREAVLSVLEQTYRPIELIIVDDGSTDDTAAVVDALARMYEDVRAVHQPNAGPGVARETGRQLARGEFIQYLDSDDLLLPRKFEWQVDALRRNRAAGIGYGKTRYYEHGQTPTNVAWKRTGEQISCMFPSFLGSRWWDTSTPLYRREITDTAGPWLQLRHEEDWEYDCRIARQNVVLCFCDRFVSDTRAHQDTRLSGRVSPQILKQRSIAHTKILEHARAAGITIDVPEMQRFARELFLLARQCGAGGLVEESKTLFELARSASTPRRASRIDFRAYNFASRLFGWVAVGRLACRLDQWRS